MNRFTPLVGLMLAVLGASSIWAAAAAPTPVRETPHLEFVQEYVRELAELERLRANAEATSKPNDPGFLSDAIYYSTRVQSALTADISRLNDMHLSSPNDAVIGLIVGFHKLKLRAHQELVEIESKVLAGPKPGMDYGAISVRMPKLRAELDDNDQSSLPLSNFVFATLIRETPDKQNHMSRLVITKAEREELLDDLHGSFGTKLNRDNKNYIVGAASLLESNLARKGYHCADEPE